MDQMLLAVPSKDQSWNWLSLEALWPSRWLSGIFWVCKLKASTVDGAKRVEDGVVYLDATIHLPLFLIFCYYFPCIRGLTNTFDGLACLRDLMKAGSPSMRRLSNTEHTSLATHFQDSGGSPIINPIPLWGGDTDPWASIRQAGTSGSDEPRNSTSGSGRNGDFESKVRKAKKSNHRLTRKKSFPRLPGLRLWRFRRSGFRLRLKRLRIMICGKIS
ncbi:hypothetical protein NC653_036743 [Populus alba x Populus x berolinensis]|uniref:Uncharacterized protein n=1 Tax=Populus alba x Populus x berolinensis TaxID=444605 RepID=A0AAD6PV82_9ROSI|nr:hypothetical protein NC653_036743 [Populus alba x Populus x berolinensis]